MVVKPVTPCDPRAANAFWPGIVPRQYIRLQILRSDMKSWGGLVPPGNDGVLFATPHDHRESPKPIYSCTWTFWIRTTQTESSGFLPKSRLFRSVLLVRERHFGSH